MDSRTRRRLYLWLEPFHNTDWVVDRATTAPPPEGRLFVKHEFGGIELFVDGEVALPEELEIELRPGPRRGLRIVWDRKVWGARGAM
ncbi:MAG: hypothetical protein WD689_04195 [Gaiellaceae bacterium]